jgi:SAM-dependent methyltransferase
MDYGRTAKYYSQLSRLWFGDALEQAHVIAAQHFPPGSTLVILGGGTGHYLPFLLDYSIIYVDISAEMLKIAKTYGGPNVTYVHADARWFSIPLNCSGVILPFLLDSWTPSEVQDRLLSLPPKCPIVVCDFREKPKGFQFLLQKCMYLFFKVFAGLRVQKMPPIEKLMREASRQKLTETSLFRSFIEIKVYA